LNFQFLNLNTESETYVKDGMQNNNNL
jgi:hypothetical protein